MWAPLAFMTHYSTQLFPKFVLSILFPLAVLVAVPATRADRGIRLAWTAFAFGCVQTYGFAEGGASFVNGNFLWSAQIACAVLYVAAARTLVVATLDRSAARSWARVGGLAACWIVLALHVASGAVTYAFSLSETPFD